MTRDNLANPLVRRALVFLMVFAITGIVMGSSFLRPTDLVAVRGTQMTVSAFSGSRYPKSTSVDRYMAPDPILYPVKTDDFFDDDSIWDVLVYPVAALYWDAVNADKPREVQAAMLAALWEEQDKDRTASKDSANKTSTEKFTYSPYIPLSKELQQFTYEQCRKNNLDYGLVMALMWRESRFQVNAVNINYNGTQDSGLMQINDINRNWLQSELGIDDLMEPKQNITAGTAMLGELTAKYGQHNALLAYQYGEAGMKRKLSQGISTTSHIQSLYKKRSELLYLISLGE